MSQLPIVIKHLRSKDLSAVGNAISYLRRNAHAFDGSLRGAGLLGAKLTNADLAGFDLANADLTDADCSGALMFEISLENAILLRTDFQKARLEYARLTGALFLTVQQLQDASSLEGSILPDGTKLPGRIEMFNPEPSWQTAFEDWCDSVAKDDDGFIIPS